MTQASSTRESCSRCAPLYFSIMLPGRAALSDWCRGNLNPDSQSSTLNLLV